MDAEKEQAKERTEPPKKEKEINKCSTPRILNTDFLLALKLFGATKLKFLP